MLGTLKRPFLSPGRPIDVVAAADVFVYFGDMSGIFEKAAWRSLEVYLHSQQELLPLAISVMAQTGVGLSDSKFGKICSPEGVL